MASETRERMFTFTTSSEKPTRRARCRNCDWSAQGNGPDVFAEADEHDCLADNGTEDTDGDR